MSRYDPTPKERPETGREPTYKDQPIELERGDHGQPQLQWIAVENPEQSVLLKEDDYILDSYFDPQFDIWEVLIRLGPETSED